MRTCLDQLLLQLRWTEVEVWAVRCLTVSSRQKKWGCLVCRSTGRRANLDIFEDSPSSDQFIQPVMKGAQEAMPLRAPDLKVDSLKSFRKGNNHLRFPLLSCPPGALITTFFTESGGSGVLVWCQDDACQAPHELLMSIIEMDWIWATCPHNEGPEQPGLLSLISISGPSAQDPSGLPVVSSLARNNSIDAVSKVLQEAESGIIMLCIWIEREKNRDSQRRRAVLTPLFFCVSPVCSKWSDSKSLKEKQRQKHTRKRGWVWLRRWTPPRKRRRRSARG